MGQCLCQPVTGGPCVLWKDSRSIHHNRIVQCGDVSACVHIDESSALWFFLNFSETLKPSFNCWEKASNQNRSRQMMVLNPGPASLPCSEICQHFMRETRLVCYEFWLYDCSAFPPHPPDPIWLTLNWGKKMLEKRSSLFCRVDKGFHNFHIHSCTENTQEVCARRLQLMNSQIILLHSVMLFIGVFMPRCVVLCLILYFVG